MGIGSVLVFRHIPLSYTVSIFSALLAYLIVLDGMLGLSSECRYINCHRRFGGEVFCVRDAPVSEDAAAEVILSGTANAEWQEAVMPLYSMHMGAALNTTARISMSTASQVTIGWLEAARTWGLSFTVWHASSSRAVVWKLEQADGTRTALSDISLAFAFGSLCPLCLSRLLAHALETRYFAEKCLPFVGWVLPRAQAITSGCYAHCRLQRRPSCSRLWRKPCQHSHSFIPPTETELSPHWRTIGGRCSSGSPGELRQRLPGLPPRAGSYAAWIELLPFNEP